MSVHVEGQGDEQTHSESQAKEEKKEKKVLSVEEHNAKIHGKVRKLMEKVVELKKDLKAVSAVKQATLAECNALSKVSLKPQAPTVKIKHAQVVTDLSKNH